MSIIGRPVAYIALWAGVAALSACGGDSGGETTVACGITEPGNSAFDRAAPYEMGTEHTGCIGGGTGDDYYTFVAPEGSAGGFVTFEVGGADAATVSLSLYGATPDAQLGQATATAPGEPVMALLAVMPNVTYHVAVKAVGTSAMPFTYHLTAMFAGTPDAYEPNDSFDEAARVSGSSADAFLFTGQTTAMAVPDAYDDYYRITVPSAGTVTIRIENVPTDTAPRLFLYDAGRSELGRVASGHRGETLTLHPLLSLPAGEYFVRVALFGTEVPPSMVVGTMPPDHFTRAYRLSVTQP